MQGDLQLNRKNLPSLNNKQQPISSLFTLIRMKKAELSRELQHLDARQISLPTVLFQKHELDPKKTEDPEDRDDVEIELESSSHSQTNREGQKQSSRKYKTILDQSDLHYKSRITHRQEIDLKPKQENKLTKLEQKQFTIKHYSRTRTETKVKQERKSMIHNASSVHKPKQVESNVSYQQSIKRFCECVQEIPKNMKLRNQQNLTETISQLEMFNPFFNRNNRIINVCLFKMGKIVYKHAPQELYKAGQQIDYFYIVLLGKVKLVEGSFKRVCETGQTVLEEVIFGDKVRKIAFERAKVVNSAYLLQMKVDEYKKMKEELIRHGLKLQYQEMEAIVKRNFIIKNWMRNKKRLQTCK